MLLPGYAKELYKYRQLLLVLAWKDIRVKYKQSVMGVLWAILMPLLVVAAGVMVRYAIAALSGRPLDFRQVATVSVKAVPWAFVVSSIKFATNSLITNANLVTKIYFPKEIFPFAAVLSQLFDFAIAAAVLMVLLGLAGVQPTVQWVWLPLILAVLIVMVMGLGTLLSAAALFFRDVRYLVEVALTFAIFFTPVFYDVSMFPGYEPYLLLNPVAPLFEGLNRVIIHQEVPSVRWLLYSSAVALLLFVMGYVLFKKAEPLFAESI